MSLANQVALVTGGTGGLGSAIVAELIAAGVRVAVPVHAPTDAAAFRMRIGVAADAPLYLVDADLTDEAAVQACVAEVGTMVGPITILVNAAGGFAGGAPVHQTAWGVWEQQLAINLKTTVLCCTAVVPQMIAAGGGSIINIGTRTVTQSGANVAAYAASKSAVMQLTEALAAELRDHLITVNAVLPSIIDTPTNRSSMPKADISRWVRPSEIAAVIRFLVGPEARIISGAAVPVYGRA
jgi:NAD(P)-dependent dehydrogenase (short-subunit alcohol dehydrogenase family)